MMTKKIAKEDRENFYQSKFEYYKVVSGYCAIIMALSEITYFFTDCQLYGRFAYETLIPRLSVLVPLLVFFLLWPRLEKYTHVMWLYYLMPHASMWSTIWAVVHLENRDFVREGFIIMHFAFLAIGLAMPVAYHMFYHGLLFANILISNTFLHYQHLDMMLSLAVPVYIGVCLLQVILENSYADHYLIKKSLEKNSVTDELTGVFNRFKITELINPDTNRFTTENSIHLIIMDIDFFKKVNDTYGHEAGDVILKYVAKRIETHLRPTDYTIRWGGEEFVLIMVGYSNESVIKVAEDIRQDIEGGDNEICSLTISAGISQYFAGESYHNCLDRADNALYYAKKNGRNQVIHYKDLK